ncbi:MATE family efflux transporter [Sphingobacterium cavernae]|uniref:hypothetical protein n=1 Tax=Sphingobacterium cavernae TaxID=2592657 RepID=UPI00122FEF59|nr:hypothetical protein [Sphingobacterium cavernae]
MKNSSILKNVSFTLIAQLSSIIVSLMFSIGVTKIFDVSDYGYWQLFILYSNYFGFMHFGICDGLYLKLGGRKLNSLNTNNTSNQFLNYFIIQFLVSILFFGISLSLVDDAIKVSMVKFLAIFLLITNIQTYLYYILLSTNEIKKYSTGMLIEKMLLILGIPFMYFVFNLQLFDLILFYILARSISVIYLIIVLKSKIFRLEYFDSRNLLIFKLYIINGLYLMFSNIFSSLIIGNTRFFVEGNFGILAFSKLSFSISMVNLFIVFIAQLGLVIFPLLRTLSLKKISTYFRPLDSFLNGFFLVAILGYYPLKWVINNYFDNYQESIDALIILLPICLFEGKIQILFNTYYKVIRKQKLLFKVNIIALAISLFMSLITVYYLANINYVLYSLVFSVIFRYILCEYFLRRELNIDFSLDLILPILISISFILLNLWVSLIAPYLYFALLIVYLIFLYNKGFLNLFLRKDVI